MSGPSTTSFQAIHPELAFVAVRNGTACWSRAFSHLNEGIMATAKAQAAMMREVFKVEPNGWLKPITLDNASDITHEWLARNKAWQDAVMLAIRQINDDLSACLFTVADDLADGLNFMNDKSNASNSVAKSVTQKAVAPTEKKVAAA